LSLSPGVYAAALTPFDGDLLPDAELALPYYRRLLQRGCTGLNLLGTTGEAMSIGAQARLSFMEALSGALPLERVMVGTGTSALADAVIFTRAAFDLGFCAALVIPPFYYREATDDGILAYFDALFERVRPPARSVVLYNFPRMSGITFRGELVGRFLREFPGIAAGIKDSSNAPALELELHALDPALAIYPGSEALLEMARAAGLAGCISGSVCLWPEIAARAWERGDPASLGELAARRKGLEGQPLIAAVRERVAEQERNPAWLRSIPPL
jgi:4-hydroxy-tetrahydrodipicolinate synthase